MTEGGQTIIFIIYAIVGLIMLVSMWRVFSKAGQPGWACIIPVYNSIVLLQIAGRPIWWLLLLFVPLVNIILMLVIYSDIAGRFGKSGGFVVGMVLLPIIFWPMLAFDSSQYTPAVTMD